MYSKRQIRKAIRLYQKCDSITKTVRKLGYPSRNTLLNNPGSMSLLSGGWKPQICY